MVTELKFDPSTASARAYGDSVAGGSAASSRSGIGKDRWDAAGAAIKTSIRAAYIRRPATTWTDNDWRTCLACSGISEYWAIRYVHYTVQPDPVQPDRSW